MRLTVAFSLCIALAAGVALAQSPDDFYRLGPDSEPQEGVPKGEVVGPLTLASEVYPGTTRHYTRQVIRWDKRSLLASLDEQS